MVVLPSTFSFIFVKISQSYNPKVAVTTLVWANPRSLATTNGITNCFLFLQVLRCFSSLRSPPFGWHVFNMPGCPIRKSADQFICANPRSLSQLITSFIASESLGIPHTPFSTFSYVLKLPNSLRHKSQWALLCSTLTVCQRTSCQFTALSYLMFG